MLLKIALVSTTQIQTFVLDMAHVQIQMFAHVMRDILARTVQSLLANALVFK